MKNFILFLLVSLVVIRCPNAASLVECPRHITFAGKKEVLTGAGVCYNGNEQIPDDSNPNYNRYDIGGDGYVLYCYYMLKRPHHMTVEYYAHANHVEIPIPAHATICRDRSFLKGTISCF